jgi:ribosomal protein S18 acetylase RimI-like enzyme
MTDFERIVECNAELQNGAAQLVVESLPEYYALFASHVTSMGKVVSDMFAMAGSSIGETMAAVQRKDSHKRSVAGIMASLPGSKLTTANLIDLRHLMTSIPVDQAVNVKRSVASFGEQIPILEPETYYLSRIAVRKDIQGSGIADDLLNAFAMSNPGYPKLSLHVKRDNARALSFYQRHGFQVFGDRLCGYLYLQKLA